MMLLFSLSYLLLALLSLSTLAHSCRPSVWAVGLSKNQTLDNHLRIIGRPISIQERRLDINGYTASIPDDDKAIFEAIRSDPNVGFLVKVPRDYFRKFDEFLAAGWAEEDDEIYEHMLQPTYQWHWLQSRDPEIIEAGHRRVPLEWEIRLEDGYSLDAHINLITHFNLDSVLIRPQGRKNAYYITFKSEEQERKSLPLIDNDPRVEAIWPRRCDVGQITYFVWIDGEDLPAWEDPCVFGLGYRQWYKEPIVTIPRRPSSMTLHPKVRSMRSKEAKTRHQDHPQKPTPAPIVYSWEAKLAKDARDFEERIARSHRELRARLTWAHAQELQKLAKTKDDDKQKGIGREGVCRILRV